MKQLEVKRRQIEYLAMALNVVLFLAIERKLGLEGSGFFLVPIMIFSMFWTFVGENLPDVLGKLIRVRRAKGQYRSVRKIRLYSLLCQTFTGIIGTVLMLIIGSALANKVYGCPYASLMVWILSPLLFLRGMSQLLLGYCQGEGFELPAVVSCLLRPVVIYVFGTILGTRTGEYGAKVSALLKAEKYSSMYVGTGWCLAIVMAEFLIILLLLLSFFGTRRMKKESEAESMRASVSFQGYAAASFRNVIFKALVCFSELFPVAIGMMIYYHKTQEGAPLSYGTYFVGYFAVCLLLYRLLNAVAVPFWGKVSSFYKRDEVRLGRVCFQGGIHLLLGLGGVLAACFAAMPSQIGAMAGFTSPNVAKIAFQGGAWILFASLGFYFARMLMRFGKNVLVVGIGILSNVLFVMVFMILWSDEKMALLSLMYACLISSAVYAVLLGAIMVQLMGGRFQWVKVVLLPAGLAIAIGIIQALCVKFLGEHLEGPYVVLFIGGIGFFAYWCILLLLRNFSEEELSVIPFGNVLLSLGKMMSVF